MAVDLAVDSSGKLIEPEGKTREFKLDLSSPEPIMRTLVAFANSAGGHLLIGVADDLTVVGVADPLREQERLANLVADSVSPKLVPLVEMVTVEGRTLLVATVALSNRRPHFVEKLGKRRGVFVRLGASNRQADGDLIKDLERGTQDLYFDRLPVITQSPDDLCDDRIEVDSPGGLLPGIAVEDMIRGTSSIRNPVLARVFAEMDLIEQWGTGVPGVFAAVAAQGLPAPEITELPKALRFTIFIQNHHPRIEPVPGTDRGASGGADPERSGAVAKPGGEVAKPGSKVAKLAGGVDETDLAVLDAASRGSVSRLDLLAAAGLTDVSGNYRRRIATLVDAGLLARTIPDKPTSPLQRYALTEAGRALLEG